MIEQVLLLQFVFEQYYSLCFRRERRLMLRDMLRSSNEMVYTLSVELGEIELEDKNEEKKIEKFVDLSLRLRATVKNLA